MNIKHYIAILLLLLFFKAGISIAQFNWSTVSSTGFTPRFALSSSVLDGKIYVIGGSNGAFLNTLEVYDPVSDSWSTPNTSGEFIPHYAHTSAVVNGKIYVIGGAKNSIELIDTVNMFDPAINVWSNVKTFEGTSFTPRFDLASCVIGSDIYVIGGEVAPYWFTNIVEIFNTESYQWRTPSFTTDSLHLVSTPVACAIDGKIFVIGHPLDTNCHCEVQIYDPQNNKWSIPSTNGISIPRTFFTANVLDGKIYIFGGQDFNHSGTAVNVTEMFDPLVNQWSIPTITGTFTFRDYLTSCVVGNKIYALGGEGGGPLSTNEVFMLQGNKVEWVDRLSFHDHIYPNPATTILNIASVEKSSAFRLVDVFGRVVISAKTLDYTSLAVDVSPLPRGAYYLVVDNQQGIPVIVGKAILTEK